MAPLGIVSRAYQWLQSVFRFLKNFVPGAQLVVGLFALLIGVTGSVMWFRRQDPLIDAFLTALTYRVEPTDQAYKGLEAVVLAAAGAEPMTIPSSLEPPERPVASQESARTLAPAFASALINVLNSPAASATSAPVPYEFAGEGPSWQRFVTVKLTDDSPAALKDTFLYIPLAVVHTTTPIDNNANAEIEGDSRVSASVSQVLGFAPLLRTFDSRRIFRDIPGTVVQTYVISATGVALLREATVTNQKSHYGRQFSGHTFLPERPYFWRAVANRLDTMQLPRSFDSAPDYESDPYVDLGINGPIRTFCWSLATAPAADPAVLCVDSALPNAAKRIQATFRRILGAEATEVHCQADTDSCDDDELEAFLREHTDTGHRELFGSIHAFPRDATNSLKFTVPISTRVDLTGRSAITLLKFDISVDQLVFRRTAYGLIALIGFAVFFTTVATLYLVYDERKASAEQLIANIDHVMLHAADAYVRVDPDDRIQNCNNAFKTLVDHEQPKGTDIKDYLTEASGDDYNTQKTTREKGEYSHYVLTLLKGNTQVTVHGMPLPIPREFQKRVPDRFGIMIPIIAPLKT